MRYFAGFAESFYFAYTHGREAFSRAPRSCIESFEGCITKKSDIDALNLEQYGLLPVPTSGPGSLGPEFAGRHPLVRLEDSRYGTEGLTRHAWSSPIPPDSFALVGSGIYISKPKFTFLQLARALPPVTMALAGCALCASYRLDVQTGKIVRCKPLCSFESIHAYLEQAKGVRGVHQAKRALNHTAECAESPQEVNLLLLSGLPLEFGGSAVKDLQLNYEVEARPEEASILDRPTRMTFRIDMGIPSLGVGIEYLGKHHDSQVDEDRERMNALLAKGYRVLQAKYQDISNPVLADRLTNQLAALLGNELPKRTPAQEVAHARLLDELFGSGRLQL